MADLSEGFKVIKGLNEWTQDKDTNTACEAFESCTRIRVYERLFPFPAYKFSNLFNYKFAMSTL